MHDPKKMAAMLMSKLENLDLDKVKGLQIGIMFDKPKKDKEYKDDDDDDYHTMPDGTKMKGKEHPEDEDETDDE
jgi:hypothetical protein